MASYVTESSIYIYLHKICFRYNSFSLSLSLSLALVTCTFTGIPQPSELDCKFAGIGVVTMELVLLG
ncbi:hypothetical protein HanHA89_Chr09g0339081 [Helianthus annuus]|nr:hypothetical protein HanHA89_Chr09g0339081 [Helianthus annuus]